MTIDGRRNGHDEHVHVAEILDPVRIGQVHGLTQFVGRGLKRAVVPSPQFVQPPGIDVEADHGEALAEFDGERQADVAEADDREPSFARFDLGKESGIAHGRACPAGVEAPLDSAAGSVVE